MGLTEEERQAVMKVVKLANNGDQGAQKIIADIKQAYYQNKRNEGSA